MRSELKPLRWNFVRHSVPPATAISASPHSSIRAAWMMALAAEEHAVDVEAW